MIVHSHGKAKRTAVLAHRASEWLLHLTVLSIAAAVVLANVVR